MHFKKTLTKSVQYLPKLLINNKWIPATEIGDSFRYLGKYFDFDMSDKKYKQELITLLEDIMSDIDLKPLHPKTKLYFILNIYFQNFLGILPLQPYQKHRLSSE